LNNTSGHMLLLVSKAAIAISTKVSIL
jgi:hypothetical protein